MNGTYRFSRPGSDGRNYMLEDMIVAVMNEGRLTEVIDQKYKAPFFDLYIAREANPKTRESNRILTGRGQTQSEFHAAMSLMAEVPEVLATGYRPTDLSRLTLVGGLGPAQDLKATDLINRMNEAASRGHTLFAFPDDDPLNIERAAQALAKVERPIDVWLIWTREHGDSRVVDLSHLKSSKNPRGLSLQDLLTKALTVSKVVAAAEGALEHSQHEKERRALLCRSIFF
jgi:hypothetical protein